MNRSFKLLAAAIVLTFTAAACTGDRGSDQGQADPQQLSASPTASSPITLSPDGTVLWVVNPDADSVTPVDTATLLAGSPLPVGREPWAVAVSASGTVVVLNRRDGTISILEAGERTDIPVGPEPGGLVLSRDGSLAHVTVSAQDRVVTVDLHSQRVIRQVDVGRQPWSIGLLPGSADSLVVTHRFARLKPGAKVTSNDGHEAWLSIIEGTRVSEVVLPPYEFGFPNVLESLVFLGDQLYVSHLLNSPELPNDFQTAISGGLTGPGSVLPAGSPVLQLNLNDPGFSTPTNFPRAIAADEPRDTVYVALAGSDSVMGIDVSSPDTPRLLGFWPTGSNPRGIAVAADGQRIFVMNHLTRDVSVLDVSRAGNLLSHRELARLNVAPETLSPQMLRGKVLFNNASDPRLSRNGWISCASCHPDGQTDGTTWHHGEGVRQTMPLWNLDGTAPFHAAGTRDELQDFEVDIEQFMSGSGLAPGPADRLLGKPNAGRSADLDALAEFVLNGIRTPAAAEQDTTATERGRTVFRQQGCSDCHYGPAWTGSHLPSPPGSMAPDDQEVVTATVHDVGTFNPAADLTGELGFDIPTLLGLHASAPYFHDGSARTLTDVLKHEGHSRPALSPGDQADLVTFLMSIDESTEPVY